MSFSISTLSVYPNALARSTNSQKPKKSKTTAKPPTTTIRRIPPLPFSTEATSYTRLPPKDDFFISSFNFPDEAVIKLSDSTITKFPNRTEIDNESDAELEPDYGKFELFEVNTDSETDDGEEEDGKLQIESENEGEEKEEKEKGVPAVMRCFDRAKIFVKAGDGGNGVVAFRREKFVPLGGPSGGDGGRGGNVYVEVDGSMNSLLPFRQSVHYRAGRGSHGQGKKMNGAKGEDVVVKVPPGTVVREGWKNGFQGDVLLELLYPGQRALLLPGGRGGRGNASFKSGTNKVPKIAENGEEGAEM